MGEYLQKQAIRLLLLSSLLIGIYIAFRFRWEYSLGAILALFHDVLFTVGAMGVWDIPLSIPVVAALLTIIGYSINDTIVIFDRIRENTGLREALGFERLVDKSINESLTRTLITSLTTLTTSLVLYFLAEGTLKDLALTLSIGVVVGTYSSSFIASPIVVLYKKWIEKSI